MKRKISVITMSLLYIIAGINHFINPGFYLKLMPAFLPLHLTLVLISGIIEVGLGLLLLLPNTRKLAAWSIIFMLLAFLPVHIQMIAEHAPTLFLAILRFVLQFGLIWWAYLFTRRAAG